MGTDETTQTPSLDEASAAEASSDEASALEQTSPDTAIDADGAAIDADADGAAEAAGVEVAASESDETVAESDEAVADTDSEAEPSSDDDDDEDEDLGPRISLFAEGDWYVIHTYAGYENKVRANLGSRIQSMNMEDKIFEVVIPTEEVMDFKSGKKQVVQRKVFPGYILVRMELDDDSWYVVRNTPGVTGFVGAGAKPTPLDLEEVSQILDQKPAERTGPRLEFESGEVVQVTSGAFNGMSGPIEEINVEQQKVRVLVNLFGRETPVELPFDQVAKL